MSAKPTSISPASVLAPSPLTSSVIERTDLAARELLKLARAEMAILIREAKYIGARKTTLDRVIKDVERLLTVEDGFQP